jgi:hypothetical protein
MIRRCCDICGSALPAANWGRKAWDGDVGSVELKAGGFRFDPDVKWEDHDGITDGIRDLARTWSFCTNRRASEPSCFDRVVTAVASLSLDLDSIPVATDAEIARLRPPLGRSVEPDQGRSAITGPIPRDVWDAALAPDGLLSAGLVEPGMAAPLIRAGIVTVAELEKRYRDGSLAAVAGIGAKRLASLAAALTQRAAAA